jgi:hypothetical protein
MKKYFWPFFNNVALCGQNIEASTTSQVLHAL